MKNLYLVGDTHGKWDNIMRMRNVENSMTIVLGDFGFVWDNASIEELDKMQKVLARQNNLILFVDGNHENFDMINTYPVVNKWGGNTHQIAENIYHLMRGQVFTIEGKTFFTMGGAGSIDKDRRAEFVSWWSQENITHAEMETAFDNLDKVDRKVDFVLSHTAPFNLAKQIHGNHDNGFTTDYNTVALQAIADYCTYDHWYFGHHHMDKTFSKYTCLFKKAVKLEGESNEN